MSGHAFAVVVADDHTLVRQSIIKAVGGEAGIEVVGEASDGPSTAEAVRRLEPNLLVVDIAMPGSDGLAVAAQLKRDLPQLRVLFLTMHDDDTSLQRALELGADGFVSKSASIDELLEAVRSIREGGSYLSSGVAGRVMRQAAGRGAPNALTLTAREREVLERLAAGRRPAEIASELYLSVKTVKNHLTSIYQKLDVETGAQAVAEAYQRGIVLRH